MYFFLNQLGHFPFADGARAPASAHAQEDAGALGPGREDAHRGRPEGSAPTWRMHPPTCYAKPSSKSYKTDLKVRIRNLGEGSDARLPSPCSSAYAQFSSQSFVQANSQSPESECHRTALMSHPKTGKRAAFLCVRHPTLAPLPAAEICLSSLPPLLCSTQQAPQRHPTLGSTAIPKRHW